MDADAISIFENKKKQFLKFLLKQKNIILTPHTGEFKRVFNYCKKLSKINKLFLHSYSIKFEDINGNQRFFDCDLPDYFKDRIKLLDFKNNFTTKELKLKNDL